MILLKYLYLIQTTTPLNLTFLLELQLQISPSRELLKCFRGQTKSTVVQCSVDGSKTWPPFPGKPQIVKRSRWAQNSQSLRKETTPRRVEETTQ